MNQYVKRIALVATLSLGGILLWKLWPNSQGVESANKEDVLPSSDKVVVSDQAQKNLKLIAKPLKADVFWKTISVQGLVVDRPGVSDREVVAPVTGIVSEIAHVPGDTVNPGDVLFKLKLASEPLHKTQTDLFKAVQDIKIAEARHKRLAAAGEGIAQARVTEVESEIARLQAAVKAYRKELSNRGLSDSEIDGIEEGTLLSEIAVTAPKKLPSTGALDTVSDQLNSAFEFEQLKVELGEQVQAGQPLCHISNHRLLAIDGRAFRDEATLLEQSVKNRWPVEVDFQETPSADWPAIEQTFFIGHIANTIDPVTRTFTFLVPLENQSTAIEHDGDSHLLWRFRPGQKVRLRIRTEKLDGVFALPSDAVVTEGADAFVFTQNVNTFERKAVHVLFRDRDQVVIGNDGSLPTYKKGEEIWTIPAIVRVAAAQLNRMAKAGSSSVPKGYHIHADGSLHKNEDEGK